MLKRFELHNHTTESDASITCAELIDLMARDRVNVFALTDHNTISGHRIVQKLLEEKKPPVQCVYGMEYTTYYGHNSELLVDVGDKNSSSAPAAKPARWRASPTRSPTARRSRAAAGLK